MDGNYRIPPLSDWAPQHDPAHAGFGDISARLSLPCLPGAVSRPSQPFCSNNLSDDEIDALMYPVAPNNPKNITVIGIQANGTCTRNKRYLPDIYQRAGIPFLCHSCGRELEKESVFIGDHQPPSKLREKSVFFNPTAQGCGIYHYIILRIYSGQPLTLYQFSYNAADPSSDRVRTVNLQTNNLEVILTLGGTYRDEITYSPSQLRQYLFPHCRDCSDRQGRIML